MKNSFFFIALTAAIILSSCTPFLYPLTEDAKQLVFKKELIGHWQDQDAVDYQVDTIAGSAGKIYSVAIIEKSREGFADTSFFKANLVSIKSSLFLDCSADPEKLKSLGETAAYSLLPVHSFIKVYTIGQDKCEVGSIEVSELYNLIEKKKISLRFETLGSDSYLFTEKTKSLQQKLLDLEKFPKVYKKTVLVRSLKP
jgi:hypothetical protein